MFEVNNQAQLKAYFVLRPTVEYYANVGGDTSRKSGVVVGSEFI